jgi:hypothetical protein
MHESIDYDEFGIGEITVWKKPTFLQSVPKNAVLVK